LRKVINVNSREGRQREERWALGRRTEPGYLDENLEGGYEPKITGCSWEEVKNKEMG
jgi:hypothetical protein